MNYLHVSPTARNSHASKMFEFFWAYAQMQGYRSQVELWGLHIRFVKFWTNSSHSYLVALSVNKRQCEYLPHEVTLE